MQTYICALRNYNFRFQGNIRIWSGIQASDFHISSLALYHLSYPGSIDGTGLNIPFESNDVQGVVVYDTICHHLTGELTSSLFILILDL